jgi:6-pyruvoyltetrahydropterin/6-carboxytetrahydropterin synthase
MRTAVVRRAQFNAAHRLNNPQWTVEQNKSFFGKCNNDNYHGHNYILEAKVIGYVNPETGYVIDTKVLADIINREIEERFDHRNLNLDTVEFASLNPTAENIARVIYDLLRPHIPQEHDLFIRLWETERNYVEYPIP